MKLLGNLVAEPPPLHANKDDVLLVGGTRIPLETVIGEYEDGATVEEIVQNYDTLHPADVHAVISYYLRHREEIRDYLRQRQLQAAEVRRQNEARFSLIGLRERLLARRDRIS
jgi:uncharacterized protein (DUF433 family)